MEFIVIAALLLPMLLASAYLLGRHFHGRQQSAAQMSPVTRQHLDLFQGGSLNESEIAEVKARFQQLLDRGEVAAVEASFQPGTQFVFQVRALAEIGTDEAGGILERQLQRRLTHNPLEQSLYWIDLAHGLRSLNRAESLPHLLRFSEATSEAPLRHFLAAETVCFLGFSGYLQRPQSRLGRSALRVLLRALEGLRNGVPPAFVAEAKLGEAVEIIWDHRDDQADPLIVRVLMEATRWLRRADNCHDLLEDDHEDYDWQVSRLRSLEPEWQAYLRNVVPDLCEQLRQATKEQRQEILMALRDLRARADATLLSQMDRFDQAEMELAFEVLSWSGDSQTGFWLRDWIGRRVPMVRRARPGLWRPQPVKQIPYAAALRALRGFPCVETESFLLLACDDRDPRFRAAALSSLGWWEPVRRPEVLGCLQTARSDSNYDVRHAARTALARLGERRALLAYGLSLTAQDPEQVHEAMQIIATEGLVLLWPDLDQLAQSEDVDIALHAREAVERFREEMDYRRTTLR